jgi:hypothetical protein
VVTPKGEPPALRKSHVNPGGAAVYENRTEAYSDMGGNIGSNYVFATFLKLDQ